MATGALQKKMMADQGYMTVADAAKVTGQNYSTIYRYMTERGIPNRKVGNRWYIEVKTLAAYYRKQDWRSPYVTMLAAAMVKLRAIRVKQDPITV